MSETFMRSNTFVLLLLRSCNPELSAIEGWGKSGKGITKPNMLLDLLHMVDPTLTPKMSTLGQYFSQFLDGSRPTSIAHPFLDPTFTSKFAMRMDAEYDAVLQQMDCFCKTYLNFKSDNAMQQLVAGLSVGIYNDKTIPKGIKFNAGTETITKADFKTHRDFILQPFLLSVWCYIVSKKANASEAIQTYKEWTGTADTNSAPPIKTKIGLNIAGEFSVTKDIGYTVPATDAVTLDEYEDIQETDENLSEAEVVETVPQASANTPHITLNFYAPVKEVYPDAKTINKNTYNTYYGVTPEGSNEQRD